MILITRKNILVLDEVPTQGSDDTPKYSINFTESGKRFVLSIYCNGSNSFLFVIATENINSKIKPYLLCLGNMSKDSKANNMKITGLNEYNYNSSVNYNITDTSNIINIH